MRKRDNRRHTEREIIIIHANMNLKYERLRALRHLKRFRIEIADQKCAEKKHKGRLSVIVGGSKRHRPVLTYPGITSVTPMPS